MRAISLHQPHAHFVAHGFKPFETRHWKTAYRGPLLIHAASRPMRSLDISVADEILGASRRDVAFGAFVCVVDLVDCLDAVSLPESQFLRSNGLGDFSIGRFAWKLENCRLLITPIRARGRQRFWNYEIDIAAHKMIPVKWRQC